VEGGELSSEGIDIDLEEFRLIPLRAIIIE
jgi:hypothetical protein